MIGIFFGVLALASLIISAMSFMEKGFLFNNAYIWASKQERERLNKKPYYRQSAILFAGAAMEFSILAIEILFQKAWLAIAVMGIGFLLLGYCIQSSIAIEKK